MAQTKVVITYSPGQARRRTVVVPDDDRQVPLHVRNVAPGEAVLVAPIGLYRLIGPDAIVERHTGRKPSSDRCVWVGPDGVVTAAENADPAIDRTHRGNGHTLRADPDGAASVGDGYHHQAYVPPLVKDNKP